MQKTRTVKSSIANIFNEAARGLAVTAINGYQKFLSPHKGFRCAHRVLYGCDSCSQYFKRVITEEGIFMAIANAKGRFADCRAANEIIKKRRSNRMYYASRAIVNLAAIESGDQESSGSPEGSENADPENLGNSQWKQKQRSATKDSANSQANNTNNNCDNFVDCADCADGISAMNCPDLNCADLNGLDCGILGCGGADCGSCG